VGRDGGGWRQHHADLAWLSLSSQRGRSVSIARDRPRRKGGGGVAGRPGAAKAERRRPVRFRDAGANAVVAERVIPRPTRARCRATHRSRAPAATFPSQNRAAVRAGLQHRSQPVRGKRRCRGVLQVDIIRMVADGRRKSAECEEKWVGRDIVCIKTPRNAAGPAKIATSGHEGIGKGATSDGSVRDLRKRRRNSEGRETRKREKESTR